MAKNRNIPFILFFVYVVFQGALRKWFFPSLGTPLYLLQYVLVFYFYISIRAKRTLQPTYTPAFQGFLMLFLGYCFLEIFNMRGTDNIMVQIYGFIMIFSFAPLTYYMSKVMVNDETFDSYLKWFAYLMIPIFVLGFVQFFSPYDAFINRYATDQKDGTYEVVTGAGGRTRITGTFSYLATYSSFIGFVLHLFFYGLLKSIIQKKLSIIFAVTLGMGVVNIFMTGSRGSALLFGLVEGLVVLYLIFTGEAKFIKNLVPLAGILGVGFLGITLSEVGSTASEDFVKRLTTTNDLNTRIEDSFDPFKDVETAGPIGFGIGTAQHPMATYLTNRADMPGYWEEESERIVIELGVIGYLLAMLLRILIFISCFRLMSSVKRIEYKILAIQMTFVQAPFLINMQTNIFNYIDGIFYWMAVGLVYFAYTMDRMDKQKNQIASTPQFGSV